MLMQKGTALFRMHRLQADSGLLSSYFRSWRLNLSVLHLSHRSFSEISGSVNILFVN